MFEGIKILNGGKEVDLSKLEINANNEIIISDLNSLKIYVNDGAKYLPAQLEVLENGSDVKVVVEDAEGNDIFLVLKNLNEILLTNQNELPVFEAFDGTEQVASFVSVDDLDAAAAGGANSSSQTGDFDDANPPSIGGDIGESGGNLDGFGRDGIPDGLAADPNYQPVVFDVTIGENEVLGVHEEGDKNLITGQFLVEDLNPEDTGLHTFAVVPGSITVTSSSGVITQIDDEIEIILNPDGTYEVSGDFNELAFDETATVSFDYTATDPQGSESLPATFTLNIAGTNDQPVIEDININNEPITVTAGLSGVTEILNNLENRFSLEYDDLDEDKWDDAGDDMYDVGNKLYINGDLQSIWETSNSSNNNSTQWGEYTFRTNPSSTVLFIENFEGGTFEINGNLGSDSDTIRFNGELDIGIEGYRVFFNQSIEEEGDDPSVNQLIITNSVNGTFVPRSEENDNLDEGTDTDGFVLEGLDEGASVYYILFAGNEAYRYDEETFINIARASIGDEVVVVENERDIYEVKDGNNVITGVLTAADDDVTDTHEFRVIGEVQVSHVEETTKIVSTGDGYEYDGAEIELEPLPIPEVSVNIVQNEETGQWEYLIEGDFNYLAVGESATITFQYVADDLNGFDGTDGINEDSVSEPKTITVTITGTNDQPVLESVVEYDTQNVLYNAENERIIETSEKNTLDEPVNTISGIINAIDDDLHDTHHFRLNYINDGQEFLSQGDDYSKQYQGIQYHRYADQHDGTSGARVVVESNDINSNLINVQDVRLYTNDKADSQINFELDGDFKALGVGQTATVTFEVIAGDGRGFDDATALHETTRSEPHYVTITVEGTNDQPVVKDVMLGGDMNSNNYLDRFTSTGDIINSNNGGNRYSEMDSEPGILNEKVQQISETEAISSLQTTIGGSDWDGAKIYLYAGETLTLTSTVSGADYYLALDDADHIVGQGDPFGNAFNWEVIDIARNIGDSISITSESDGWYYIGTGGGNISNILTNITITNGSQIIYETHDDDAYENVLDDTQDDIATLYEGELRVQDDDAEDTHTFYLVADSPSVDNMPDDNDSLEVIIDEESGEYSVEGDFNYLAAGETATVTFEYYAEDNQSITDPSDPNHELSRSDPATVTLEITGTNDQPIVENVATVVSEESLDNLAYGQNLFEDAVFTASVSSNVSDDDDTDTHTFAIDEGTLTLSITTTNQRFLDFFSIELLQELEEMVDNDSNMNEIIDFIVTNDDNSDIADSVTLETAQEFTIPQNIIDMLVSNGILNIEMDDNGTYTVSSPVFNYLGAHDSITIGFDYRATDQNANRVTPNLTFDGSDNINETSVSEAKTITLTVEGTNDKPIAYSKDYDSTESELIPTDIPTNTGSVHATFEALLPGADTGDILDNIFTRMNMSPESMDEDLFDLATLKFFAEGDNASAVTTVVEELDVDQVDHDLTVVDLNATTVVVNEDGSFTVTNPTFDQLAVGESATVTFKYYVDDQSGAISTADTHEEEEVDNLHESTRSDAVEVTVTITGTNDRPLLEKLTFGDDTEGQTIIYESKDPSAPDNNIDDTQDEDILSDLNGQLSVLRDDDVNDEHIFDVRTIENTDYPSGVTSDNIRTASYDSGTVDMIVEADDSVLSDLTLDTITLLDNDGVDSVTDFNLTGNFNALAAGEKATVTFKYVADDQRGKLIGDTPEDELSESEANYVTITVTGTNDQPIVENIVLGAQVFSAEDTPVTIVNNAISEINVSDVARIDDLNVHINLDHTWDSDLDIYLLAPDGVTRVELTTDNGSFRDNYRNTEFNDEANQDITSSSAPFKGVFRPEGNLSDFENIDPNGTWTLQVGDDFPWADDGTVLNWSLEFNSETYFESYSGVDAVGVDDTAGDDTGAVDENLTVLSNILTASDDDNNDAHTMHITNMAELGTTLDAMTQTIGYIDGISSTDDAGVERVVKVESNDVDVSSLRIDRIELSNNDDATDSQSNFDLYGDFSSLASGESATITFAYQAQDSSLNQTEGESSLSEVKTVTITVTGTNDKPLVSAESYGINDATYGDTYYETSDLDGRDDYDTDGYNHDNDGRHRYTQNDEDNNVLKGKISVEDIDTNDKHHFYVTNTAGDYAENISSIDGDRDWRDWVVVESNDIAPSNIDLNSIKLLNASNNPSNSNYFSTFDEIEFELKGNFSKLGAGQEATVTFSYIAVDDSQQHLPGESNTSEVQTVTLTVTGTNDEPIIWSVDNGNGVLETTIANAATQAEANVLAAGGTQTEADAAKLAAMSTQTQADRFGNDIEVPVEVRTSYFDTVSGWDIDIEDTHTLHMKDTTASGDTITVSTDDGDMQAAFSATSGVSASDIENLSIDFRTLADDQTSIQQTYSYLITGDFSSLGRGESATIVFDYVAKDNSGIGVNGEPDESDVKQITFKIWGTNDQPVITSYDSSSEITETNQALDLPLAQLQQIAYDAAYNEIMDPFSNPLVIATQFGGDTAAYTQAVLEAEAAAIMAGDIAREKVVVNDEFTVYGDGLGTIYGNDVIEGHDDDINDKHALFLTDLAPTNSAEELLIDFSTSNGTFSDTGTDVKAVFTSDSANVTAADIKDVSVVFDTTSDALGSNDQQYTYQVVGNYNALGNGETATITFAYVVADNSGPDNNINHETRTSEVHEITLTITGTNDKPIVQADSDSVLESTISPVTTITTQLEVEDADDTDMVEGHLFHIQDALPSAEVNGTDIYSIRYVNIDTNTIGFVQVEIDGPLEDIDTTKITLRINGSDLSLQGEFDPLAGEYTDNSNTVIPAEELSFRFKYFADDQNGFDGTDGSNENSLSDSKWMTITVTGTNDVPTIVDKNTPESMDEDRHVDNGMLKTVGSVEVDDLDHGQDYFSTTVTPPSNDIGGIFNFNEDGTWDYEVNNSLAAIQALKENEYIDQTYIVTSIDGTDTHPITVRIWGTEDISIIGNNSELVGGVTEDVSVVSDTISTTGILYITDPDNFPNEAAFNESTVYNTAFSDGAQLGTLTLVNQDATSRVFPNGNATWTYDVDNTDPRVQALAEGETIRQVFTVTPADGSPGENITITITGTNDGPTLDAITSASIVDTEAVDVFADIVGSLSGNDVDANAILTYSVSGTDLDPRDGVIEVEGNYGTLVLITSSGEYTYTPDADKINALAVDATDTFTFVANDGIVDSLPQDLVINITAADDMPIIVDEPDFSVDEDGAVFTGILEATDVDTTTLTYEVVGDTPAGLTVNSNGTYSFDPSVVEYQSLNAGQTTQVSFQWKATDGNLDTATDTVTVTIMGTNDTATIINPENFTVQAEQEQNFLRLDTNGQVIEDASQALNMADFARVGTGIKALDITGGVGPSQNGNNWNDAFSFVLLSGESALVTLEDATPADSLVTIYQVVAPNTYVEVPTANGAGDYVVRIASSNPAGSADFKLRIAIIGDDVKEDTITTISGEMEVIDVDAGENIFKELTDVVLPNGYGEFSISPTGTWTYDLFNTDQRIQALAEGEELFETFTVESFDGTATEDITIRIEGTNDLPVATVHTDTLTDTIGPNNLSTSVDVVTDDRAADTNDLSETYSIKDSSVSIASITVDGLSTVVTGLTAVKSGNNINFTAGNSFEFLDNAEVAKVTIYYMLDDGTQSVPSRLVITVNGTNDLPVITSTNTFTINEHDALDNAIHDSIESNAYDQSMTIVQNEANGSLVGQVTATDAENDTLEYQLVKVNGVSTGDISYQDIFHLNTSDGKIYLKQNVDAEVLDTYTLDVRVVGLNTDGTTNYATQQITVNVSDLNDNAPVLAVTGVLADVDENSQGTTLATLTVTDADGTPPNAAQTVGNFTITGTDAALVEVVNNSGTFELRLKTNADLDFEEPNTNLDVNVVYNDGLNDSNQEPVSISVNDLNDNAPVIMFTAVSGGINELAPIGTKIGDISITDADQTSNINPALDATNFIIGGTDASKVKVVETSTGVFELQLDEVLNFETPLSSLDLTLTYNDGVNTPATAIDTDVSVRDIEGNISITTPIEIVSNTFNDDNNNGWTTVGWFNNYDDKLGWFNNDEYATKSFSLDNYAGETLIVSYVSQYWDLEGNESIIAYLNDGSGWIPVNSHSPYGYNDGNQEIQTFEINVPNSGNFSIGFQGSNFSPNDWWAMDNFKITTKGGDEVLTLDSSNEGEIDMAALLSQANDFNGLDAGKTVPDSLDEIDLTSGDHILSNINVEDVIKMTDSDYTLNITGDSDDIVKLNMQEWQQDGTNPNMYTNKVALTDVDDGSGGTVSVTDGAVKLLIDDDVQVV